MTRIVFDEPPWWERPGWQVAAAAALALVALPIWWTALSPIEHEPVALNTRAPLPPPAARAAPTETLAPAQTLAPAATPLPAATDPLASMPALAARARSIMVAPGVHITPLSVPPGTVPMPAGPGANDSEPEN